MATFPSRLRGIIPLDRLESALRSPWLPFVMLLLALSTVFVFGGDRGSFYRPGHHNWTSSHQLTLAVNLSPEHGFQRFVRRFVDDDGVTRYQPYNRFPIGGYAAMKVAALPFGENPSTQLYAARILMLLFFSGAAILAYLSLCRLTSNRWVALTATLLAFSSYYLLYYNDMTSQESMPDFFGVMLTFHGMVVFVQEGRFRQLLLKTCVALLLGWHVFALLLPFVIFGLVSDLLRTRSAAAASTAAAALWIRRIASALLRSRYLLLGVVALGFGLCVLAFNFTMEYAAMNGETQLTELPSFKSMLKRTGSDSEFNTALADELSWGPFLEGQFRSVLRMFIPYSLLGPLSDLDGLDPADESPMWLSKGWGVALGVVLSAACLIGAIFVRPRILFVTLASFGFFWALPMRNLTYHHDFESVFYIGIPLVCFTIVLLLARRLTNRDGVIAAASVAALLLFTVSSFQMSSVGHSAETVQAAKVAQQELLDIRKTTAGEPVSVLNARSSTKNFFAWPRAGHAMDYYLNSHPIYYAYLKGRFVVMRERVDTDALLTPENQHFFLYDKAGLEAWFESVYRSVSSGEPAGREEFDVYFDGDRTVYYLKEPCERADSLDTLATAPSFFLRGDPIDEADTLDTDLRFYLHVYPIDERYLPVHRRQYGYDNLDFIFVERGVLFDGKCLARFVLPEYDVSKFVTGRLYRAWGVVHHVQPPEVVLESESIASNENPVARGEFDVYIDGGKLYYIKEPCVHADTRTRFFLHIIPEDIDDLPEARRQYGYDNLDFDFGVHGALFDGKCTAAVPLPQYNTARIMTGQFDGTGRIWSVVHHILPPEVILESQSVASNEPPAARGEFDVYIDGGKLYYVKEPCVRADTRARFLLHIVPEDVNDLPEVRRDVGYDNLDFDWRGDLFEGRCAAAVSLPEYTIARIITGQFYSTGRIWGVEFAPEAGR